MDKELSLYISSKKETVESELKKYFSISSVSESLTNSMAYSLFAGCKRLRPILAIAATEVLGESEDKVLPFACSLELIHTYSLIHDDLPCMDDDDLRRGKASNHKVFGEAMAILAGDALLTLAFEIASNPVKNLAPQTQLKIIRNLARSCGWQGMVAGQVLDIEGEEKQLGLHELEKIHLHKTGKLIQCAIQVGTLAGGADKNQEEALSKYGRSIGFAFQVTDDILDYKGAVPGKNPRGDLKNNKSTFATVLGVEKSREVVNQSIGKAIESLKGFGDKASNLTKMAEFIRNRIK